MFISSILFLIIFTVGTVGTFLIDCSIGIYLYQLIYYFNPTNKYWVMFPGIRYSLICAFVIILTLALKKNRYGNTKFFNMPQAKWFAYMFFAMVVISMYAIWPEEHYKALENQTKTFIIIFIAYKVIDTFLKFKILIWTHIIGCFYISYYAHFLGRDQFGRVENIGTSDGFDANTTAATLITALPLICNFILCGKRYERILAVAISIVIINALILINSRGAFLGLLFALFYFSKRILKISKLNERKVGYFFSIIFFFIVVLIYFSDNVFWTRTGSLFNLSTEKESVPRTLFWIKSLEVLKDHLFGLGARGFEFLSPAIMPLEWLEPGFGKRAIHSTFFQALSDFGILGIPLIFGLFISNYNLLNKGFKISLLFKDTNSYFYLSGLASSFYSFLIAGLFINRFYSDVLYWLMIYMAIYYKIMINSAIKINKRVSSSS